MRSRGRALQGHPAWDGGTASQMLCRLSPKLAQDFCLLTARQGMAAPSRHAPPRPSWPAPAQCETYACSACPAAPWMALGNPNPTFRPSTLIGIPLEAHPLLEGICKRLNGLGVPQNLHEEVAGVVHGRAGVPARVQPGQGGGGGWRQGFTNGLAVQQRWGRRTISGPKPPYHIKLPVEDPLGVLHITVIHAIRAVPITSDLCSFYPRLQLL